MRNKRVDVRPHPVPLPQERVNRVRRSRVRHARVGTCTWLPTLALAAVVALLFSLSVRAADEPPKKALFLPQNPRAAAYVLGRLSDKELIEAPRSEFVYVALLERKGLERKYRIEALEGLAKIRNTDAVTELIG